MQSHLNSGDILHGKLDYTIDHRLGIGGFGATYLANADVQLGNISHQLPFTIKELTATEYEQQFLREAQRLSKLQPHPGIVRVNEVFRQNNTVYYVMEYLGNQNLEDYVKVNGGRLSEQQATHIFRLVAQALDFLHSQNITHLDVKPANIMMRHASGSLSPTPVLIDFGLAVHYGKSGDPTRQHSVICCSDGYSPLEQYLGINSFSPTADIYALGATLFFMLTGEKPPMASEISESLIDSKLVNHISPKLLAILKKCMSKLPEMRYQTLSTMLTELSDNETVPSTRLEAEATEHTKVIGQKSTAKRGKTAKPKTAKPLEKNSQFSPTMLKKVAFAIAATLIFAAIALAISKFGQTKTNADGATDQAIADTSTLYKKNASLTQKENLESENKEASTVTNQEKPTVTTTQSIEHKDVAKQKPATVDQQNAQEQKPMPEPVQKPESNTLDLGYAHYSGVIQDGKPHGNGTLTFYASHSIETNDSEVRMASPGDKVTGKFVKGKLSFGRWTKTSGEVESLVIGN